jgi:hypothetical protein
MTDKPKPIKRRKTGIEKARTTPTRYQAMVKAIEEGTFSLDMLDEEELLRGRLRNAAGDFRGRPPILIPQAMAVELIRRQKQLILEELGPITRDALKAMHAMVQHGTTVHDGPRAQMVKLALEYGLGKPVDKVEVNVEAKVEHYGNVVLDSTVPIDAEVEDEL